VSVPDPAKRHTPAPPPRIESAAAHQGDSEDRPATTTARSVLELVGLVIAPTTLVAALAFFFGWTITNSRAAYFGIDASALGFSTQDYVLRSVDAMFVPVGAVLVLGLLAVILHALVTRALRDPRQRPALRVAARCVVAVGALLFVLGVVAVFETLSFSPHYLFAPASPGVGIALVAYGIYVLALLAGPEARTAARLLNRPLTLTLVGLLIVLSAFWTASRYADALGRGRAKDLAAELEGQPRVTVFAPRRLQLTGAGVTEQPLGGRESAYRYSYAGLRLLTKGGGKYFLLPEDWSTEVGAAIVLPDSSALRYEFEAGE
jgi:hypothetical protein